VARSCCRFGKRGESSQSVPGLNSVASSAAVDDVESGVQFAVAPPSLSYPLVHPSQRYNVASRFMDANPVTSSAQQRFMAAAAAPVLPYNGMLYMNYPLRFRRQSRDNMSGSEGSRFSTETDLESESDD